MARLRHQTIFGWGTLATGGATWRRAAAAGWAITCLGVMLLSSTLIPEVGATELTTAAAPPPTRPDNVTEELHGVEIVDPYRWLEDQNSTETRSWIEAQNQYTESILGDLPGRATMMEDLESLMRIDKTYYPIHRGGRYFFTRRLADDDLSSIYMRKGHTGVDAVLVDPHTLSPDHTISANLMAVSPDGKLIVYGLREGGEDEVALRFLDTDTREHLPDEFPKGRYYSIEIEDDKSGFYYGRYDSLGERIYYHRMGDDPADDAMVFGEGYAPEMGISVDLSDDGRYLLFIVYEGSAARRTQVYIRDLAAGGETMTIVDDIDAAFGGYIGGKTLFLKTTWESPNGRIIAVDLDNPSRDNWAEIIPETQATLTGFKLTGGKLMVRYLSSVIPAIKIFEPDGSVVTSVTPPTIGWMGSISGQWHDDKAFFSFSTFHVPGIIYLYDVGKQTQIVWDETEVPIDLDDFVVRQEWFESKDGTRVPMFITHGRGMNLDGENPVLLSGYGGFNSSMLPYYSSRIALLVKAGGVYAVPNLRGGGEFGDEWHRAGMLEHKQNTFDDFIAAAEWLIDNQYTSPDRLAIMGGSNGGLLVGAALTQRPELFKAVVCTYPLLDMIRYHKFLVAKWWVPEYGSSDDPGQFKYILDYSPYHNVVKGTEYPAVLFVTGDSDTRVDPCHARKMTALLQAATGSDAPVLLHYDTTAGHSGGRPLSKSIEDATDRMLFLFWQIGIEP